MCLFNVCMYCLLCKCSRCIRNLNEGILKKTSNAITNCEVNFCLLSTVKFLLTFSRWQCRSCRITTFSLAHLKIYKLTQPQPLNPAWHHCAGFILLAWYASNNLSTNDFGFFSKLKTTWPYSHWRCGNYFTWITCLVFNQQSITKWLWLFLPN